MRGQGALDVDRRWREFVEANDRARETLHLADAAAAGRAYRAWCLGEDQPVEPLNEYRLMLWRHVREWADAAKRGVPGALGELCIARGRFVHSYYVDPKKARAAGQ